MPLCSFRISGIGYPVMQHHIPVERYPETTLNLIALQKCVLLDLLQAGDGKSYQKYTVNKPYSIILAVTYRCALFSQYFIEMLCIFLCEMFVSFIHLLQYENVADRSSCV